MFNRFISIDRPTCIFPIVTFRVVFGLMMIVSTGRFLYLDWVKAHYLDAKLNFKYFGFEWIKVLPDYWMYGLHYLMLLAAFGIMLGAFYQLCTVLFFLSFTYIQLIDITYYLNHYYFVSLVAFLMIFVPAHAYASVDVLRGVVKPQREVPSWTINILKFQIGVVYVFAGLAKINYDWLVLALPLKIWLPAADKIPVFGLVFKQPISAYLFCWGGMMYDVFIVFLLMYKPTRVFAYIMVVVFHVLVGILFQIGVFPMVMIGATLIFFSNSWHGRFWERFPWGLQMRNDERYIALPKYKSNPIVLRLTRSLLLVYVIFQLLFPWRYLLYDGDVFWNEEGYRFSWRVMLMEKAATATFYVKDTHTGREGVVNNTDFLCTHQEKQMAMQPDLILQYAHYLRDYYQKIGVKNPSVRAEIYVTLNARPSQLLINPNIDLTQLKDTWAPKQWVLAYEK